MIDIMFFSSRFCAQLQDPATKICLLLWEFSSCYYLVREGHGMGVSVLVEDCLKQIWFSASILSWKELSSAISKIGHKSISEWHFRDLISNLSTFLTIWEGKWIVKAIFYPIYRRIFRLNIFFPLFSHILSMLSGISSV